jgi:imidazolonepropionase-like amidohydrolase
MLRFTAAFAILLAAPAVAETVLLSGAKMLDVRSGALRTNPRILISDGRIAAVGFDDGPVLTVPAEARRIEVRDLTLMPGLIDVHVHLSDNPAFEGLRSLPFTDSFWTVHGVASARTLLELGFTTVRNLGRDLNDVGIKQAVEEGLVVGPRIVPSGFQLGATGGHCDYGRMVPPSYRLTAPAMGDSPDELRRRVREQRKNGAQAIKVCATGGVFSRNPGEQQLSEAELRAVQEEAAMWGMKVASHAHGAEGIKASIRSGISVIEHASFIDEEGIALAKSRGAWLSMDVYNTEYVQAEGRRNGVSEVSLRTDREVALIQREAFRRAHEAGVRMVFGTDVGGSMPHALAPRQFATMVQLGMTPVEAIRTATINAAAALGRERDVGEVAVGKFADIIGVYGDPTDDISLLQQVRFVMKGGEVMRQDP